MSDFKIFKQAVNTQLEQMTSQKVFQVAGNKDDLWDLYLASFPEGTNPHFRERTVHDCNCCKQFIRNIGLAVTIVEGELVSVWDVHVGNFFDEVAAALSAYVKSLPIHNIYLHTEKNVGTDHNHGQHEGVVERWEHFHFKLPSALVSNNLGSDLGNTLTNKEMLQRAVSSLTKDALTTVQDLINDGLLYRGEEHLTSVLNFKEVFDQFQMVPESQQDLWLWKTASEVPHVTRFRNSVIGTLIVDLSEGVPPETAVASFESKVAPENYKRTKSIITQKMIQAAKTQVTELGLEDALQRRYAVLDDITINNVLYADHAFKEAKGVFDTLMEKVPDTLPKGQEQEISINDFLENVMPTASSIEVLLDNAHKNNLVSLIAPVNTEAKNILKWDNNFSWSYQGEVTDSMKERVKSAGGNVDGVLRFSLEWNNNNNDSYVDLDAHCFEPDRNHIYYSRRNSRTTNGVLDVDIQEPMCAVAVENITWPSTSKMLKGEYVFSVVNYSGCHSADGFNAEIEFNGKIHSFHYPKAIAVKDTVQVARVHFDGKNFTLKADLPCSSQPQSVWGISTEKFHEVSSIMLSPNHWDGQTQGNKHWFFMLKDCVNPDQSRGFYNEFLAPELTTHRKVFEHLGAQLKTPVSDNQLSGLGFSSTKRDQLIVRVTNSKSSIYKINF